MVMLPVSLSSRVVTVPLSIQARLGKATEPEPPPAPSIDRTPSSTPEVGPIAVQFTNVIDQKHLNKKGQPYGGLPHINPLNKDSLVVVGDCHGIPAYVGQALKVFNVSPANPQSPTLVFTGDGLCDKQGDDAKFNAQGQLVGGGLLQFSTWLSQNPNFYMTMGNHEITGLLILLSGAKFTPDTKTMHPLQEALRWPDLEEDTPISKPFSKGHRTTPYHSLLASPAYHNPELCPKIKEAYLELLPHTELVHYHEPTKTLMSHNLLTPKNLNRYLKAFDLAPTPVWERWQEVRHPGMADKTPTLWDKVCYVLDFPAQWKKAHLFSNPKETVDSLNQAWQAFGTRLRNQGGLTEVRLSKGERHLTPPEQAERLHAKQVQRGQELRTLRLIESASIQSDFFDDMAKQRPHMNDTFDAQSDLPTSKWLKGRAWPWAQSGQVDTITHGHTSIPGVIPVDRGYSRPPLSLVGLNVTQASTENVLLDDFPVGVFRPFPPHQHGETKQTSSEKH
ncbi:MAG: metallophosphoesterase [Vampirovibrionales bacterium]